MMAKNLEHRGYEAEILYHRSVALKCNEREYFLAVYMGS